MDRQQVDERTVPHVRIHMKNRWRSTEVHPGFLDKSSGREDEGFIHTVQLAHALADYVKEMGYTHVN